MYACKLAKVSPVVSKKMLKRIVAANEPIPLTANGTTIGHAIMLRIEGKYLVGDCPIDLDSFDYSAWASDGTIRSIEILNWSKLVLDVYGRRWS